MSFVYRIAAVADAMDDFCVVRDTNVNASDAGTISAAVNRESVLRNR
jgi:hypothetical protein